MNGEQIRERVHQRFAAAFALLEPAAVEAYDRRWIRIVDDVNHTLLSRPDIDDLIGGNPLDVVLDNHNCHANFVKSVLRLRSVRCFVAVVTWVYRSYIARGFNAEYFSIELWAWRRSVQHRLSDVNATSILAFYDAMISSHGDFVKLASEDEPAVSVEPEFAAVVEQFLEALLSADARGAENIAREKYRSAAALPLWWEKVVTPAMHTIGRLWADGEISVAQEHMATAIVQRVMSRSFPRLPSVRRRGETLLVVVPPQEKHEVGATVIRDYLELHGYDVRFTGADTPARSVAALISENRIAVVLISVTMPFNLLSTQQLIDQIRDLPGETPQIVAGGQAFRTDPELCRSVGADVCVERLTDLLRALESLGCMAPYATVT